MICAMRSTPPRRGASSTGDLAWISSVASSRRYAGISKIGHGGNRFARTFIAASGSGSWTRSAECPTRPILVAGRSGQLARCLVESAAQRETRLVAIGRPELDVEDARSIEHAVRAVEPSAIVNAAAYTAVDRAESEPGRAFAVNRDGAERLAVEARKAGVPFIQISTDYVFDGRKSSPYTEEDRNSTTRRLWPLETRRRRGSS